MNPVIFSALAEPSRFQIVELLRDKPRPVGELSNRLHIRQPQVSKHLKVLADAGIVEVRPQANQRIYELSPKRFQEIDKWLNNYRKLWEDRFDALEKVLGREKAKLKKRK
jgi:DNA-binding transcriptional ArsR family regulator